jgi:transposase
MPKSPVTAKPGRCHAPALINAAPAAAASALPLVVVGGVDTHLDTHTVVAVDGGLGIRLGTAVFPADHRGYQGLWDWLSRFGLLGRVGIEGTSSYGAGLARFLHDRQVEVIEVNRPNRQHRRLKGKSDPIDAEQAARAVLAGTATAVPKSHHASVEAIRVLFNTRTSAVAGRTAAINQLHSVVVTAPEPLRAQLRELSTAKLVAAVARLRPGPNFADPTQATKKALRTLADRIRYFDTEITQTTNLLDPLVADRAPRLIAEFGVGTLTAAQLLITAGDNPDRLHTAEAFVALCGANPIPVASGRTHRHRLNRGGDRQANRALYTIAITRIRSHPETQAFIARITTTKTRKDILRILKRYIARRLYTLLIEPAPAIP